MTVSVQPVFSSTEASGSSTVFSYPFKILEETDLKVSVNGVVQTSGYTVSGVGNGMGGDVTFSVAPAAGAIVLLELDPILSRDTDYQQYGPFPAPVVNADFDRMWKALQKFANDFKRSLKLPTDTGTDQVVNFTAGERANALLAFDSSGNLTITPITSIAVSVSAGSFTVDTFSGDGVTTGFTLSRDPGIKNNTAVFVDGVYVQKSAYSITGTTLTFTSAPASGTANVEVTQSVALTAGAPSDGTVTVASLADAALAATTQGLAKMADGFLAASSAARAKMADKFLTLAKMADMGTGKLLGNISGVSGTPAEVSTDIAGSVAGLSKNLALSTNGTNATVNVSADAISVESAANIFQTLRSVSLAINTAAAGANGLDTGTLAGSTWYSVWVIWNGTTIAGLISASATAPTLPSGYTHKARVGWIRTDGTANKYPLAFVQYGRRVQYKPSAGSNTTDYPTLASGVAGTFSASSFVFTAVSTAGGIPSTASAIALAIQQPNGAGLAGVHPNQVPTGGYNGSSFPLISNSNSAGANSSVTGEFALETAATVYYCSNNASAALRCTGWEDNL